MKNFDGGAQKTTVWQPFGLKAKEARESGQESLFAADTFDREV